MLVENPKTGIPLGNKSFKIRLQCSDSSKGKRGGYRIISFVMDENKKIRLLTIYAKSQKTNISDDEILLQKNGFPFIAIFAFKKKDSTTKNVLKNEKVEYANKVGQNYGL